MVGLTVAAAGAAGDRLRDTKLGPSERIQEIRNQILEKLMGKAKQSWNLSTQNRVLMSTFRLMDENRNGVLTFNELRAGLGPALLHLALSDEGRCEILRRTVTVQHLCVLSDITS